SKRYKTKRSVMFFMRHAEVDDGQHHEDERLQRDDQQVKNGPRQRERPLYPPGEQRDQDEDQLAGVQVAEKSQAERDRLRELFDQFQDHVERDEPLAEGREQDLLGEPPDALDLDAVEQDQEEHRDGHGKGGVQVRTGYHTQIMDAHE